MAKCYSGMCPKVNYAVFDHFSLYKYITCCHVDDMHNFNDFAVLSNVES